MRVSVGLRVWGVTRQGGDRPQPCDQVGADLRRSEHLGASTEAEHPGTERVSVHTRHVEHHDACVLARHGSSAQFGSNHVGERWIDGHFGGAGTIVGLTQELGIGGERSTNVETLGTLERLVRVRHHIALDPIDAVGAHLGMVSIVTDGVPESLSEQQPVRVELALDPAVTKGDRVATARCGPQDREGNVLDHVGHHRRAGQHRAAELPQTLLAGVRSDRRDRHLERVTFIVIEVQSTEFVPIAIDAIRRLTSLIATQHLGLDGHTDVAQERLVALERPPQGNVLIGVHASQLVRHLLERQRHTCLEQQRQEIRDSFERRRTHRIECRGFRAAPADSGAPAHPCADR